MHVPAMMWFNEQHLCAEGLDLSQDLLKSCLLDTDRVGVFHPLPKDVWKPNGTKNVLPAKSASKSVPAKPQTPVGYGNVWTPIPNGSSKYSNSSTVPSNPILSNLEPQKGPSESNLKQRADQNFLHPSTVSDGRDREQNLNPPVSSSTQWAMHYLCEVHTLWSMTILELVVRCILLTRCTALV